jgi:hypothetical protein
MSTVVLIPSFYGFVFWAPCLYLYWLRILPWDKPAESAMMMFILVPCMFCLSLLMHFSRYRVWQRLRRQLDVQPACNSGMVAALHVVGFIGIVSYVFSFAAVLGGLTNFWTLLVTAPYVIRWQASDTFSIGTQLSYAGWVAIALTVVLVNTQRLSKRWLIAAALQFTGNALFLGRTRLFWILTVTVIMLAPVAKCRLSLGRVVIIGAALVSILVGVFVAVGAWIGKLQAANVLQKDSDVPFVVQNVYVYSTAGFAYFNRIVETESPRPGFEGVAAPLYQVGNLLGLTPAPRSQVNEELYIPYGVNVGTFLEPFFRDGGYPLTMAGILFNTLCIDYVALLLWRSNNYLGWHASAQLCFTSAMAGFTPKITTFPIWLFLGGAAVSMLLQRGRGSLSGR